MYKRFLALAALVLVLGFVTNAFAQTQADQRPLTRAGAVALLVAADPALKERQEFFDEHHPPLPLFDDVDYSQWYASSIEAAFEAGIITGNDTRTFRPGAFITDDEAVVLGARYMAMHRPGMVTQLNAGGQDWFNAAVSAASQNGAVLPQPLAPGEAIGRQEFYAMITSMGVQNPAQIASSLNGGQQQPVIVAYEPTTPVTTPRVVTNPTPRPYVPVTNPTPTPQPTPTPTPAPTQKYFAISMPTLGITDLNISHPADPTTKDGLLAPLKSGVGHLFSYPGKGGTILIYGHSSSYPWDVSKFTKIFRQINKLNVGDTIYITYNGSVRTYRVSSKETVDAADMSAYQGGNGEQVILYTCWPPDSIKQRYLVRAIPTEAVAQN